MSKSKSLTKADASFLASIKRDIKAQKKRYAILNKKFPGVLKRKRTRSRKRSMKSRSRKRSKKRHSKH